MSQSLKDEFVQGSSTVSMVSPAAFAGRRLGPILGQEKQDALELEFGAKVLAFPFPEQMLVRNIRTLLAAGKISGANKLAGLLPNSPRYRELKEVLSPPRFRAVKNVRLTDPRPDYNWIVKNSQEFEQKWVALKEGELLADADTLKCLQSKLTQTKPTLIYHIQSAKNS